MTRRFRLLLSGSCALLSAVLCLAYGEHIREESERVRAEALERYGGEVVTLVVATEGIEAGESVSRSNVSERDWLVDLAPENAVTGLDTVIGAEVSVPVAAGVPLTELNFRDATEAVEVPSDRVALSVPLDDDLGVPPGTEAGESLAASLSSAVERGSALRRVHHDRGRARRGGPSARRERRGEPEAGAPRRAGIGARRGGTERTDERPGGVGAGGERGRGRDALGRGR